jgi:hypothetical protein
VTKPKSRVAQATSKGKFHHALDCIDGLRSHDAGVRGSIGGRERGFVLSQGSFVQDRSRAPALSDAALQSLVGAVTPSLTFTCVPPGSGWRLGIDRDGDGFADGDELAAGSSPADPNSVP